MNIDYTKPVAEIVSAYGDPEAFGERSIKVLENLRQYPYGTKLFASGWRPIETAPEDGTMVLAKGWDRGIKGGHRHYVIAEYYKGWYEKSEDGSCLDFLTHWQPISLLEDE